MHSVGNELIRNIWGQWCSRFVPILLSMRWDPKSNLILEQRFKVVSVTY